MKLRILPRIPGTVRDKTYAAVEPEISQALRWIARQHHCSVSFVKNTILADALNIKVPLRYYDIKKTIRRVK